MSKKIYVVIKTPTILNVDRIESFVQDEVVSETGDPIFTITLSRSQGSTIKVTSKYLEKLIRTVE